MKGREAMNGDERKKEILRMLQARERLSVDELSTHFGLSKVTIRGDLEELQRKGCLLRTHGGALLTEKQENGRTPSGNEDAKKEIALLASTLVSEGQTLIVDGGTTTLHMAPYLSGKNLTVATNSLPLMQELRGDESVSLTLVGGLLRRGSLCAIGELADECLSRLHASWLFLGGSGYSVKGGVSCANLVEARTKRAMIGSAAQVCLLADSSKRGHDSFAHVADWNDIDVLVTDWIDTETRITLEGYGVKVMIAPTRA